MAFHYKRDGSYVGGLPAFLGGLVGVVIFLGLHFSVGLNFFLSLILGAAIPIIVMALLNHTPHNYSGIIIGKWDCVTESVKYSKEKPIYSLEFRKDGTLIWDELRSRKPFNYEIKRNMIVIDGEKRFKIDYLFEKSVMMVIDCETKERVEFKYGFNYNL